MTSLTKSIEAARDGLNYAWEMLEFGYGTFESKNIAAKKIMKEALSAIPTKPITDKEIFEIMYAAYYKEDGGGFYECIRSLRDAGCLYVSEEK